MPYSFKEHIHRYASWTAARAVQRAFTKTPNITFAINQSSLPRFTELNIASQEHFDNFHRVCANELIHGFAMKDVTASYGQAAKIISIYLKTAVLLPYTADGKYAAIIHPPIDNILLVAIAKKYKKSRLRNYNRQNQKLRAVN